MSWLENELNVPVLNKECLKCEWKPITRVFLEMVCYKEVYLQIRGREKRESRERRKRIEEKGNKRRKREDKEKNNVCDKGGEEDRREAGILVAGNVYW